MLNFETPQILSVRAENKFFGENLRYARVKSFSVQGKIYDLTNSDGISGIWSGISGVVSSANDYDDIQLQGFSFGPGRIDSVDFTEGVDVREKVYRATFTVFDTGNLFNVTGNYYSGIDFSNARLIERLSEEFSFDVSLEGNYTYQQTVSVKFDPGSITGQPLTMAKSLVSGLFFSFPEFGFINSQYSGFYLESGKRLYKESYNLISNECSFTQGLNLPAQDSGGYSVHFSYSTKIDDRGVTTVDEQGLIQGLILPLSGSAETGYEAVIGGALGRCQSEYNQLATSGYPLNSTTIVLSKKINSFEGTIGYSISYNNDPALDQSSLYSWDYADDIRRDYCINYITEQGHIKGMSTTCTFTDRYANAEVGWSVIQTGIPERIYAFASGVGVTGALRVYDNKIETSVYKGEITYSVTYTDQLVSTSTTGIIKIESETQDDLPVQLVNKFVAYGFGGTEGKEIVQPANIATPGDRTSTFKVYGVLGTDRSVLLAAALSGLNTQVPTGIDVYVTNCGYSWGVTRNVLTAKASWRFYNDWAFSDITV